MRVVNRGDVYFCRGSPGAIGSEERKERPVVIVQNDVGNTCSPTVIVAPLTSNIRRYRYPMQFDVDLPDRLRPRVLCDQIMAVDKSRLLNKVYTLSRHELQKLDRCLKVSLGLQ